MNDKTIKTTASIGLIIGSIFGIVGSFIPDTSIRGLAWGIDGVALILASALLTIYFFRKGMDITAGGFLIFAIGQGLIVSTGGIDLDENVAAFGAGAGLWAAALFVICSQKTFPLFIRITGLLTAVLFAIVAVQVFMGNPVNALTKPLPFYAYPVFVITLLGWTLTLFKKPAQF